MRGYIRDFLRRFENEKELEIWLRRQSKDRLFNMYLEETNYECGSYRDVTRKELKDAIREEFQKILEIREEQNEECQAFYNQQK